MATVILSREANKDLNSLPKIEQKKIIKKLVVLRSEPFLGKLLSGELKGFRSLKAWPYRILYEFENSRIMVHRIVHRQGAYK